MTNRRREGASDWTPDELPELPDPWIWECGKLDGDPIAVRAIHGVETRVYEAYAGANFDHSLAISVIRNGIFSKHLIVKNTRMASIVYDIPFQVFESVKKALRWWNATVCHGSNELRPPPPLI